MLARDAFQRLLDMIDAQIDALERRIAEYERQIAAIVEEGSDIAKHGVVRGPRSDLAKLIADRFGVILVERTVGKLLHGLGFRRLSVRPAHPKGDGEARRVQNNFADLVAETLP